MVGSLKTKREMAPVTVHVEELYEMGARKSHEQLPEDGGVCSLDSRLSPSRSQEDRVVIAWEPYDPDNPYNWSEPKKGMILFLSSLLVINSTMSSTLPSMAVPKIAEEFDIRSPVQRVLPISVFLLGYVLAPIVWAPLSEHIGRRALTIVTFTTFSLFTAACALAPSWPTLLVFRLFCGVFASSPIAVAAGMLADVYGEPRTRGRALAIYMVTTIFGPLLSPIISSFTSSTIGWRWAFWVDLILAGVTLVLLVFLPETYGPILLACRARKMREEQGQIHVIAPRDLEESSLGRLMTVVLLRPIRMLATEPIVSATCAFLALAYAIFYVSFQAFPIIFQYLYGLSPGVTGLCYLPIGVGASFSLPIFWYWDNVQAKAQARGAPWAAREEFRRVPLAFCGGPLFVVSLFWLGFTARLSTSFVVPMLAGIPFGMGFMLIFTALLNYLTDAYELFAASVNAAASCSRSLLAVVLPLATGRMFDKLGISGACALLGGLSAIMSIVPFIFIWKGPSLRSSRIALQQDKEVRRRKVTRQAEPLELSRIATKGETSV